MVAGMRLDSVRELAQAAGISKMTVEKAYYQLASEGYILRRHKARYEAASLGGLEPRPADAAAPVLCEASRHPVYAYDFASGDMALERFPLDIWRKYMNRILSEPDRLLAANDDQGVPDLRLALKPLRLRNAWRPCRSVERSIIGAGTISLLGVLTNLLHDKYTCIGVEDPGICLGRRDFPQQRRFHPTPFPSAAACSTSMPWKPAASAWSTSARPISSRRGRSCRPVSATAAALGGKDGRPDSSKTIMTANCATMAGLSRPCKDWTVRAASSTWAPCPRYCPFLSASAIWSCRYRSCPSMSSGAAVFR